MNQVEIGQLIQQRRIGLSLKQEDLAEMTGITTKTIYSIENGKGNPSISSFSKLFEVLGLEMMVQVKIVGE
ncbi:MAG: helix-turn-helix domain-containing protein [Bacteroidetes bacterium]|nr:helix-turn-helix domain-containing protein [Bacteroidota bacterium]